MGSICMRYVIEEELKNKLNGCKFNLFTLPTEIFSILGKEIEKEFDKLNIKISPMKFVKLAVAGLCPVDMFGKNFCKKQCKQGCYPIGQRLLVIKACRHEYLYEIFCGIKEFLYNLKVGI